MYSEIEMKQSECYAQPSIVQKQEGERERKKTFETKYQLWKISLVTARQILEMLVKSMQKPKYWKWDNKTNVCNWIVIVEL